MKLTDFTDERIEAVLAGAPLSAEERDFLAAYTSNFEECQPEKAADLLRLNDTDLMRRCYDVWCDYARGQM